MRLFWIVYTGATPERVATALHSLGAPGWTRLDHAHGAGTHGRIEGSRAWPGEETVFMAIVPGERVAALTDGLAAEQQRLAKGERLHFAVAPIEHFQ
jgi:hypothetical protein